MIDQTRSHYPALRDPERRDKILAKLGEGGMPSFIEKYNKLVPPGGRRCV